MRVVSVFLGLFLLAAACGGAGDEEQASRTTVAFTDPAREQLDWLLGAARSGALGADVLEQRFTDAFLETIGGLGLIEGLVELGLTTDDWQVVESEFGLFEGVAVLRNADGDRLQLLIGTRSVPPYEIDELRGSPLSPEFEGGLSEDAVDARIQTLGRASWGIFEVAGPSCIPLAGTNVDEPGPIGATFGLWVLAAVASAIDDGSAAFDELLAVRDEHKSTIDGQVGVSAEGTNLPLRRYAELMIGIQDNSATDHLIARLGREAVEQAMVDAGVAASALNMPLLTTREFFILKSMALRGSVDGYLARDGSGRRAYLEDELAGVTLDEIGFDGPAWDAPTLIEDIGWYASPSDLCRSHAHVAELGRRPGLDAVAELFGVNTGVPMDEEVWSRVRFESGSEPGVFTASWYLERVDGRSFVVAGTISDTARPVDETEAIALLQALIDLAAAA